MINKNTAKLVDFIRGTTLWLKIIVFLVIIMISSYLLSQIDFWLGFLLYLYLIIFAMSGNIGVLFDGFGSYLAQAWAIIAFPILLFFIINYFYICEKRGKNVGWSFITLFILWTVLYVVSTLFGWFIFLVWHP